MFCLGAALCVGASPVAASAAARAHASGKTVTITVRLIQEVTYHLPNHFLSTSLRLYAVGSVLGFPNGTYLGNMSFTYQLNGSCSASGAGCSGTTNLQTVTSFPGGTIKAGGAKIALSTGLIVPVESGTGIFKGATGSIDIAPGGQASSIYHLVIPS